MSEDKSKSDQNLDELLDSCLKDFENSSISSNQSSTETNDQSANAKSSSGEGKNTEPELFNEEFFAEQAKLLSERMNGIFNSGEVPTAPTPDQLNIGFQKLAEAAALALQGDIVTGDTEASNYANSITEALRGLRDGSENLQAPFTDNDVANMFSNIGLDSNQSPGEESNPFLPFMQGMMQSLLSAELLLPSITELLDKYPKYLEDNAEKLSPEDKTRYGKQLELFKVLATELEAEKPDDSATVKQNRLQKILDNMQKLHEYGQPPEELIADINGGAGALPDFGFNPNNLPGGPGNQCPMM